MKLIFFILISILVSCGESPLLNHSMEKSISKVLTQEELDSCPATEARFVKINYSVKISWQNCLPAKGEEKLRLWIWENTKGTAYGPYQDLPDNLLVDIQMPDMGHGSVPVKMNKIGPGEYDVTRIFFIMGGNWDLHIRNIKDGNLVDEIKLPYSL